MSSSYLSIKGLNKTYTNNGLTTEVLKGLDFELEKGGFLSIEGPSGSGKSTLLSILGLLEKPTGGSLLIRGEDPKLWSENQRDAFRNREMGFVFQFHHLLPDFSALENVMMPLLIRGEDKSAAQRQALIFLDKCGLSHRVEHFPAELSGGEQQRVAIARAVVGAPNLILADEPTGNLDHQTGLKIFDLLLSLNRELKTTLVMVTHNKDLARRFDKRLQLVDGKFV